jgi:hypothetical protein
MYGIVNKAVEDLIITNFGVENWELIKEKGGVDIDFFISNEPYDDDITFKLAVATSEVMGVSVGDVLVLLGEWWVLKTTKDKYPGLLNSGGNNFKDFIINLPNFHNRVMLIYPKLTPPEFKVSDIEDNSLHLHYYSKREGLREFVRGLIQGLGKMYNTSVAIDLLQNRDEGSTHEIFKISW